jgi:AraC-like DNA-binding protein
VEEARDSTISLRWVLPFVQVTGVDPRRVELFERAGVSPLDFASSDVRISHRVALELLEQAVASTGDPVLGLRAGEAVDPASLDVVVLAARSCATLRHSILCANRYLGLLDESLHGELLENGDSATWEILTSCKAPPASANEFTIAAAYSLARQFTGKTLELTEVHFRHAAVADLTEYRRVFGGAELKFSMPRNAILFRRELLETTLLHAHQGLQAVYEMRASALLGRLRAPESTTSRVRQLTIAHLRVGDASMSNVARNLGMSVATLRRRLQREDKVFSDILDEVRRELAEEHLADPTLPIVEIASLLGFSHVAAFYKAFRRWFGGTTPAGFRARKRAAERNGLEGALGAA